MDLDGDPILVTRVAAQLDGVAALLAGEALVGIPFLLLRVGALLGGVALLYSPELPRTLVAWLAKRDALPLTADVTRVISDVDSHRISPWPEGG